jgi:hypothetical protein
MGYAVRRIPGRCIGLKSKPQGAKKQLTTAVDLDALLDLPGGKRKTWLEAEAGTTLPPKAATALKDAGSETELLEALASRIDRDLFEGPQAAGSLVFQPTEERRRSGSHYTPRALTRPIVAEALRPWLERCHHQPTAAQILDLKICDPAMGSGAFLVESCRFLAELLEQAWNREGVPEALQPGGSAHGEEPLLYARRLIAQGCLYGVDKNPFAVNLARLSLWLVSLSKDAPFTFVDHALKCGDSLVGMERSEIEKALKGASRQREIQMAYLDQVRQQEAKSFATFHADSRSDADDAQKRQALDELNASTAYLRTVGDLLVAAYFNGKKPKDREELKQLYLAATLEHNTAAELEDELAEPLERLREGVKGIQPLHWQLAFPDVFGRPEPGFDVFVGNPPFAGVSTFKSAYPDEVLDYWKAFYPESGGQCDLVAYFFRKCFENTRSSGSLCLVATNTISQGDTRASGLDYICSQGGVVYFAERSLKWPGGAAVFVSKVAIAKSFSPEPKILDGRIVESIGSYLLPVSVFSPPCRLKLNSGYAFTGSYPYGNGFLFDSKANPQTDHDPGKPSSIKALEELLSHEPAAQEVIHPYLGGDEFNTNPCHEHHRYVVDLRDMDKDAAATRYPYTFAILERKVMPERTALNPDGSYKLRRPLPEKWWIHAEKRPALYQKISAITADEGERADETWLYPKILCHAFISKFYQFSYLEIDRVFASPNILFPGANFEVFASLQSNIHGLWCAVFGSTVGEGVLYATTDCLETFPLPYCIESHALAHEIDHSILIGLREAGRHYFHDRADLMQSLGEGMTEVYIRFHDPAETSPGLLELRRLHGEMDQAVLRAYGWSDEATACGFGLDYLDLEDDAQPPDDLQDRIDSGELFFWEADVACAFEAQVRAYGAVKGKKKFPWRYRWPDDVRDDVLARLLALNAERYAEEVAQGLHGKTGKKPATNSAIDGKRRGRPAKAAESSDTGQIGLAL